MSRYRGMLLFDIADEPIGKWHENLGTRGYYDKWENKDENGNVTQSVIIDLDEDSDGQWEAYWENADGKEEFIKYGCYDDVIKSAKEFMKEHPNGL